MEHKNKKDEYEIQLKINDMKRIIKSLINKVNQIKNNQNHKPDFRYCNK
jgi:hypothetical protein